MMVLGTNGPANMEVWISSPVRSKKPVLMNTTRSLAERIHSFRLTVVRRSSSMMPIFIVKRGKPSASSIRPNNTSANATSSGPCILGLTMFTEPAVEFWNGALPFRSCIAIRVVIMPSMIPSGTSAPSASKIAGLVIRCPTLRMNNIERPFSLTVSPLTPWYSRSGFMVRVKVLPPLVTSSARSPFIRPNQLP